MREIKFRVWDKKYKTYDYNTSPEIFISTEGEVFEMDYRNFGTQSYLEYNRSDDYELSQYTGQKDKNGKEIYEGDIVKFSMPDTPYVLQGAGYQDVDIQEGFTKKGTVSFLYSCWFVDEGEQRGVPLDFDENQTVEVIGNIHENPELLEEAE